MCMPGADQGHAGDQQGVWVGSAASMNAGDRQQDRGARGHHKGKSSSNVNCVE